MIGIVLGLTLVSGQLMNAYAGLGATAADWATHMEFDFAQVRMIGYQAQVILLFSPRLPSITFERFFKKDHAIRHSDDRGALLSLLLAVMAAHFVLGPIGWTIGS